MRIKASHHLLFLDHRYFKHINKQNCKPSKKKKKIHNLITIYYVFRVYSHLDSLLLIYCHVVSNQVKCILYQDPILFLSYKISVPSLHMPLSQFNKQTNERITTIILQWQLLCSYYYSQKLFTKNGNNYIVRYYPGSAPDISMAACPSLHPKI